MSGFFLGGALDVNDAVRDGKVDAGDAAESLAPFLDCVTDSVRHVWVAIARFEHVPDFQTLGYNNKRSIRELTFVTSTISEIIFRKISRV